MRSIVIEFKVCGGETGTSSLDDFMALDTAERLKPAPCLQSMWWSGERSAELCVFRTVESLALRLIFCG